MWYSMEEGDRNMINLQGGHSITTSNPKNTPIVTIDKEYWRREFQIVFDKWQTKLRIGMTLEDQENILNELMKSF